MRGPRARLLRLSRGCRRAIVAFLQGNYWTLIRLYTRGIYGEAPRRLIKEKIYNLLNDDRKLFARKLV